MKTRILVLISFFVFGICLLNLGCFGSCNCGTVNLFFDVKDVKHNFLKSTGEESTAVINDGETINFEELNSLYVQFEVDYISSNHNSQCWNLNMLYACDCDPSGIEGSKTEKFENIKVTTLVDFNDEFLTGSDISELFKIRFQYNVVNFREDDLVYFLATNEENLDNEIFKLILKQKPQYGELKFKIDIELSNNENYSMTTNLIKVN